MFVFVCRAAKVIVDYIHIAIKSLKGIANASDAVVETHIPLLRGSMGASSSSSLRGLATAELSDGTHIAIALARCKGYGDIAHYVT